MKAAMSSSLMVFRSSIKSDIHKAMLTTLASAARVLALAAASQVPVDTGMARSTWVPLGRYLNTSIPISPKSTRRGRSPERGEQQSSFDFNISGSVVSFRWSSSVLHYALNEQYATVPRAPWKSLEYGLEKAKEDIRANAGGLVLNAIKSNITIKKKVY